MRIGIDARVIFGRKTGDRSYAINLLRNLPLVRPQFEFVAFAERGRGHAADGRSGAFSIADKAPLIRLSSASGWHFSQVALPAGARAFNVDLLHVQYIGPILVRHKFVTTIHDVSWRRLPECFPARNRLLLNIFIPITLRLACAVITDSHASREDLIRIFRVAPEMVHAIPLGVSDEFFVPPTQRECDELLSRYGLKQGYALYLGVIQPRKNLHRLIEAVAMLRDNGMWQSDWGLVMGGKLGWHYERLFCAIERLNLSGIIKFIGYVEDEQLRPLYACARVFVYPSLWEGFGLPVVEAMASGVPVITSGVGALKEIAEGAAFLVNPYDVVSIADALHKLMSDDSLCESLRKAGKERAMQFTWRKTAELTASVYESVVRKAK